MVFSSAVFLFAYLPIVFLGYYAIPKKYALAFLFVMNFVFYGWGEPVYLFLMIFSIALNYAAALSIGRFNRKKLILAVALAVNLALIGFYKYSGLIASTFYALAPQLAKLLRESSAPGFVADFTAPPLPIGISFYTFQAMAYIIDVYRGNLAAERSVLKFGTFIALFPQLTAGPIVMYRDVADDIGKREARLSDIEKGLKIFICGLSKKLLLANAVGLAWERFGGAPGANGVAGAWVGLILYAFHIYFDFGGYSDMAVGLGMALGFKFPANFNYPYVSKSITEFWRRWHITLSSWFRDYVYIPLGGSRRSAARNLFNLVAVWLLTGLWHGASWNFVMWGLYFAVVLIAERTFLLKAFDRIKLPALLRRAYAFAIVVVGWGLFALTDFSQSFAYIAEMFGRTAPGGMPFSTSALRYAAAYVPTLLLCCLAATPLPKRAWSAITGGGQKFRAVETAGALALLALCVASMTAGGYNPFIYYRF